MQRHFFAPIVSSLCFAAIIVLFQNCGEFDAHTCESCKGSESIANSSSGENSVLVDTEITPIDLARDPITNYESREVAQDLYVGAVSAQESLGLENYNAQNEFKFNSQFLNLLIQQYSSGQLTDKDVIDFYAMAESATQAELIHSVKLSQIISTNDKRRETYGILNLDVASSEALNPKLRISFSGVKVLIDGLKSLHTGSYWIVVRLANKNIRFPNWQLAIETADCAPGEYFTAEVPSELSALDGIFVERLGSGNFGRMSTRALIERTYPGQFSNFYGVNFNVAGQDGFAQGQVGTTVKKEICDRYIPFVNPVDQATSRAVGGEITFECRAQKWRVIGNTCEFVSR